MVCSLMVQETQARSISPTNRLVGRLYWRTVKTLSDQCTLCAVAFSCVWGRCVTLVRRTRAEHSSGHSSEWSEFLWWLSTVGYSSHSSSKIMRQNWATQLRHRILLFEGRPPPITLRLHSYSPQLSSGHCSRLRPPDKRCITIREANVFAWGIHLVAGLGAHMTLYV